MMNNIEGGSINGESESAMTDNYIPSIPANWISPLPNTVQQALDRMAAILSNNGISPIS
jgi:hypothetical protein